MNSVKGDCVIFGYLWYTLMGHVIFAYTWYTLRHIVVSFQDICLLKCSTCCKITNKLQSIKKRTSFCERNITVTMKAEPKNTANMK
jgi:hypothetical protein